ncbi:MAG: hypothetical protein R3F59_22935 [Myxococcota bacterium]
MTRLPPVLLLLAACVPEQPDDTRTTVITAGSPTSSPSETHRLLFQVDGSAPVERLIDDDDVSLHTAVGSGCSATAMVVTEGVQLHFPALPAPDVEAPLPEAVQPDPSDPFAPAFHLLSVDGFVVLGGKVQVVDFDATQWRFRFEGVSNCSPTDQPCAPMPDVTLTIEPLDGEPMPGLDDLCVDAGAFPWPDGWDGCAVSQAAPTGTDDGSGDAVTCPSPMPW